MHEYGTNSTRLHGSDHIGHVFIYTLLVITCCNPVHGNTIRANAVIDRVDNRLDIDIIAAAYYHAAAFFQVNCGLGNEFVQFRAAQCRLRTISYRIV